MTEEKILFAAGFINGSSLKSIYRTCDARTIIKNGKAFFYPSASSVQHEMYKFVERNNSLSNSVERAVHSHFNIARIHPFEDGNGRLARVLQNGILSCKGYPVISIGIHERNQYLDLLEAASLEYKENNGKSGAEVSTFYNFLTLKLRDSLMEAKSKLGSKVRFGKLI